MDYKDIQALKERYSKEDFENILLAVEQDLKFNNLRFKKQISKKRFLEILNTTEVLFRRLNEESK